MQHHPGSWYIPWGVPLQKMLAVPFNHPGAATAGYHHQPQIGAAAVQPQQAQHTQQQTQQSYQHQMHSAAALHNSAAALQHQSMHPAAAAAAAAMFTPLTLRSFVTHPHLNLGQQPLAAAAQQPQQTLSNQTQSQLTALNINLNNLNGVVPVRQNAQTNGGLIMPMRKVN